MHHVAAKTTESKTAPLANTALGPLEDIAVIGMACRFPGAKNYSEFWENLAKGRCDVREIPVERWDGDAYYSAEPATPNRGVSKWGGFIEDADQFDASFFRITPREAELMDPQQRIMLELTWSCLEDAGYRPSRLRGSSTGVYIGACNFDYKELLNKHVSNIEAHLSTGTYGALIANRISYEFDLKGPSMPIDTACSSSLVALDQAVHALRRNECSVALVGGISILCSPTYFVAFSKAGMLSPDGLCRTFDHRANGYVRAEGAGLVLLKPLARAVQDGDRVWGLIKSTAVNHCGKMAGVTSPSAFAQSRVIVDAHRKAGTFPDSIGFIECHGTGTPKGDPIEVHALKRAFGTLATDYGVSLREKSCGIGSVKTNIGHLEAAAGMAGIIKTLLSMNRASLPGLLHFSKLNPRIELHKSPFYVVDAQQPWLPPVDGGPRRAGVSSFGFGGVNAHAVIEEYRSRGPQPGCAPLAWPVMLSAKTDERLQEYARTVLEHLRLRPENHTNLAGIAYSLQRREPMAKRLLFFAESIPDLKAKLELVERDERNERLIHRYNLADGVALAPAVNDEDCGRLLAELISERNSAGIAGLWNAGHEVGWDSLYNGIYTKPALQELPTYPFEKRRYWLPASDGPVRLQKAPVLERPSNTRRDALWEVIDEWTRQTPRADSSRRTGDRLYLTLLNAEGEIAAKTLLSTGDVCRLPVCEDPASGTSWADASWEAISLIRAALLRSRPALIVFLSNENQEWAAVVFALLQSVKKEVGVELRWYAWDSSCERRKTTLGSVIEADLVDDQVERGERRLRADGEQVLCERRTFQVKAFSRQGARPVSAEGGVYWIPGGGGGIGRTIAAHLQRNYGATVILSGRSKDGGGKSAGGLTESPHGSILYRSADCTKRKNMEELFSWILDRYGKLTGVIHSAGVLRDKSLLAKTRQDVHDVMTAKIDGALVLDDVTKDHKLDQFILFSSVIAIVGNAGQTDYAAANAFLTQFARSRQQRVMKGERAGDTSVIHWPYWRDGGMRLPDHLVERLQESSGVQPLTDEDGLAAFDHVLATRPLTKYFAYGSGDAIAAAWTSTLADMASTAAAAEPIAQVGRGPDAEDVPAMLSKLVAELTGIASGELRPSAHFAEYGVDSLMLQSLMTGLNGAHNLNLTILDLHNNPSITELSSFIVNESRAARASSTSTQPPAEVNPASRMMRSDDVAIVGINFELAGATSLDELWKILNSEPRAPTPYPQERWHLLPKDLVRNMSPEDCIGYYIEDVLRFDHALFNISPREAMLMDPQQRMLLQSVWRGIENAGYSRAEFARRRTCVLLSIDAVDYERLVECDAKVDEFTATGVSRYVAANRISHVFNLHGMSEPINTACSSYFVALGRASEAISSGAADQAVVAAAQLNLLPGRFRVLRERGLLSMTGATLPFDGRADGFVRSEGVGCVILKSLTRALEDGDHVYGVIRGVGTWHAGTSMGLAAPNSSAHQEAIKQALIRSGTSVERLAYVEAHGTATTLGDASELDAIDTVFAQLGRSRGDRCLLGAAKATLGHLEAASGMAALMKGILTLQKGEVPGLAHLQEPNAIFNPDGCIMLSTTAQPVPQNADGSPATAGLLSYGLGGVSAFLVLEGYRNEGRAPVNQSMDRPELFVLSAQSESVLKLYLNKVASFIRGRVARGESVHFGQLVSTYQSRREHMSHRVAMVARDALELASKIESLLSGAVVENAFTSSATDARRCASADDATLEQWLAERKWPSLARAWVAGAVVPWRAGEYPRCQFPEYPFDSRRRPWIAIEAG